MLNKIWDGIVKVWQLTAGWREIFSVFLSDTLKIIINPSYVMFSGIAIALATLGIWIEFLPMGFSEKPEWYRQLNNTSVFTFCIALLGSMAVEYIFDSKGEAGKYDSEKELHKHMAFFFWFLALILSFASLKSDWGVVAGLSSTILLWLYVNSYREKFNKQSTEAINALNPKFNKKDEPELGGDGLQ
ncbi:hypothetical protein CLH62_00235 [Marinobacter guineae]|uniref:Uncharacterized protein n=1 Tax=Marinobacter guineae TaxID=432303 RepID=A0A2G1VH30_9GAMM|nr:hypothetical protein [Marinobacter guineae]PHQ26078.1 hypothetical protein CLH62_00235 [Marinobacter guineae]